MESLKTLLLERINRCIKCGRLFARGDDWCRYCDDDKEEALEQAYWDYIALRGGSGRYKGHPRSERDAFKMIVRGLFAKN